jgi:hypothetical protein
LKIDEYPPLFHWTNQLFKEIYKDHIIIPPGAFVSYWAGTPIMAVEHQLVKELNRS